MNSKQDANYFHRVVDCQYACPAHTDVPQYIRLIADKRYTEAYMVNRASNVFPGILGRVCDRPCEPACRRGRVEEEPVAICRLKRVASDFKDDISTFLPLIPEKPNGKTIALIGAGPASLTVINDLLSLGYEFVLFDKNPTPGGAMQTQVPGFRLPQNILDEEIATIIDRGRVKKNFGQPVTSLKSLLDESYDAIFVASGAPEGKDLKLPGRLEGQNSIHVGVDFLANVHFKHQTSVKSKVMVIGGGNTAMDCCRTALRLGAKNVQVVVPESYDEMLASPWEKEDALAEGVTMTNHRLPHSFLVKDGVFFGVRFQKLRSLFNEKKEWAPVLESDELEDIPCDEVILAIGQRLHFPFIEDSLGLKKHDKERFQVHPVTFQSSHPKVFFGGDSAFGPKNIITAVEHGHQAAISIHLFCEGKDPTQDRLPFAMNLVSQKMTMNQWSYSNDYSFDIRRNVPHMPKAKRLEALSNEVELGFDEALAMKEAARCLNCDVQTVFSAPLCIECDACVDICPVQCLTMTPAQEDETNLRHSLRPPALNLDQQIFTDVLPQTQRLMVKDEDICIHCGLCAERCPTGAWDMQKFFLMKPMATTHT